MNAAFDQPLSEQYRIAGERWVDLDDAARMLEEAKSAVLAQRMQEHADKPVSRAEMEVKASKDWAEYITAMVRARTKANKAKLAMDTAKMRHSEQQSSEATRRAEMKL